MNIKKLNEKLDKVLNEISDDTKQSYLQKRQAQLDKAKKAMDKAKRSVDKSNQRQYDALPEQTNSDNARQALNTLKLKLQKYGGEDYSIFEQDNTIYLDVRYWGDWEGSDDEEDYDWERLSDRSKEILDEIIYEVSKEYEVKINRDISEKHWISFDIDVDDTGFYIQETENFISWAKDILEPTGWKSTDISNTEAHFTSKNYPNLRLEISGGEDDEIYVNLYNTSEEHIVGQSTYTMYDTYYSHMSKGGVQKTIDACFDDYKQEKIDELDDTQDFCNEQLIKAGWNCEEYMNDDNASIYTNKEYPKIQLVITSLGGDGMDIAVEIPGTYFYKRVYTYEFNDEFDTKQINQVLKKVSQIYNKLK